MGYNEDGYMIEEYERCKGEKFFQIWFEWLDTPLRGSVNDAGQTEHFETREQAQRIAKQEINKRRETE